MAGQHGHTVCAYACVMCSTMQPQVKNTHSCTHVCSHALASKMQQPSQVGAQTTTFTGMWFYMYTVHAQEGGIIEFMCGI